MKLGQKMSPESCAKMSASHTGMCVPDEIRAKMSSSHKGKSKSPEHRKNISIARKGWKFSEETRAKMSVSKTTHGMIASREYRSWLGMRQRCASGGKYASRGITVCDMWLNSFENFYADMGQRPAGTSIDRVDNNGNYEPENCRWATAKIQANNRRKPLKAELANG